MRSSPRDLAAGCNGRVWSGIRRLTALAALPQASGAFLGGAERIPLGLGALSALFPVSPGAALGPIPRASVLSPAYLMWPVPPGVSVGATDTTVLGFLFWVYGSCSEFAWLRASSKSGRLLGLIITSVDLSTIAFEKDRWPFRSSV